MASFHTMPSYAMHILCMETQLRRWHAQPIVYWGREKPSNGTISWGRMLGHTQKYNCLIGCRCSIVLQYRDIQGGILIQSTMLAMYVRTFVQHNGCWSVKDKESSNCGGATISSVVLKVPIAWVTGDWCLPTLPSLPPPPPSRLSLINWSVFLPSNWIQNKHLCLGWYDANWIRPPVACKAMYENLHHGKKMECEVMITYKTTSGILDNFFSKLVSINRTIPLLTN